MTYMNPSFKETGSRQFQPSSVNLTPGHLFGLQATQTPKIYERIGHSFRLQRGRKTHLTKRNWQQKAGASLNYQTHPFPNHKKSALWKKHFVVSDILPLLTFQDLPGPCLGALPIGRGTWPPSVALSDCFCLVCLVDPKHNTHDSLIHHDSNKNHSGILGMAAWVSWVCDWYLLEEQTRLEQVDLNSRKCASISTCAAWHCCNWMI